MPRYIVTRMKKDPKVPARYQRAGWMAFDTRHQQHGQVQPTKALAQADANHLNARATHPIPQDGQERANLYTQCWSDRDSHVGSFLYNPKTGKQPSPTCPTLVELFAWCRANGWQQETPGSLTSAYTKVQP